MSVQDLKDFGKKCVEDAEARKKAKKIGVDNIDGLIKLAKEYGFTVEKKDFTELGNEAKKSDELNEEQLQQIAGGVFTITAGSLVAGLALGAGAAGAVGIAAGIQVTRRW